MQDLADFYPGWRLDVTDKSILKKWYNQFKNNKKEHFIKAVDQYIENESYPPNVAGIKKYLPYWPEDTVSKKEVEKFVQRNYK